ncbi:MAG: BatD family protein [Chloroflexota bacterium]
MKNWIRQKNRALASAQAQQRPGLLSIFSLRSCLQFVSVLLAIAVLLMLWPRSAGGQEPPITASVNTTAIATDELVVLTVIVVDDSAQQPRPLLPRLDGLAVVDLDIATDVDLVNNQIQTRVVYTYRLQPRRTGALTIPPVSVKIDDKTYKTSPISIKVTQGAAPVPAPGLAVNPDDISPPADIEGKDFYIEAVVDLPTPYLGQQLIYTFRFYQALQIYREPQFEPPLLTEFEMMGLPVQEYNLDLAGRTYLVTEIRTALFAKMAGKITIGPARLMLPGNIYEEPLELYTDPIQITVRPLPDDAPPGFNGAVGQYDIKAWFSPEVAVVHQPATLFVAVTGIGNIRELPELIWPELDGWQAYNSLTSLTTAMEKNVMTGTRVYERVMVPGQIGDFLIPAINFVYFDPIAGEYRTLSTEVLSARVIPAPTPDPAALVPAPTATPLAGAPDAPAPSGQVGLSAWAGLWEMVRSAVASLPILVVVGVCGLLPAALVAGLGGSWLWQRRHRLISRAKPRSKPPTLTEEPLTRPRQSIHPALVAAMKNNTDNYKSVSLALNAYLSEKLQTPVNGLTRTQLADQLRQRGLSQALIERVQDCLTQSEIGRYGGVTADIGWSLMVETDAVLFDLDKALGTKEQGDS